MRRKRNQPWIHRYSRFIMGAIATIGLCLTSYLTFVKFTGGEVACTADVTEPISGCNNVLNSVYAEIFGIPLSLFGLLAYLGMLILAIGPLFLKEKTTNRSSKNQLENWSWQLLLIGGTGMAVFSSYLMFILTTELQTTCYYCITSAVSSISLFILAIIGREWEDLGQVLFTSFIVGLITIVGAVGILPLGLSDRVSPPSLVGGENAPQPIPLPSRQPQAPIGWETTTTSSQAEIALAQHLTNIGAIKYGAFWCPHCYAQKQLFGKEAFEQINYVECDPRGENGQPQVCQAAGVRSYPTWKINGQEYSGTQSLEKLAEISGYNGPNNFKYFVPRSR